MSTPLDTYDEYKNWVWLNHQRQVPVEADKMNIQAQSLRDHVRRAVCELIGNGAGYDGFLIDVSNPLNPTIKAGSLFIAGYKLDLEEDTLYFEQPGLISAPAITHPAEGLYYLSLTEEEIDSTDDPQIVDPLLAIECVKPHRLKWIVKYKASPFTLPNPSANEYTMSLYLTSSTPPFSNLDLRNSGVVKAGSNTRYEDREGGRLGGGHGHWLVDTWVVTLPSGDPDYISSDFQTVMDDVIERLRAVEGGVVLASAKGGGLSTGTYGVLTGNINGSNRVYDLPDKYVPGSLHVYVNTSRLSPDGDDYVETSPSTKRFTMEIAPETDSIIIVDYIEDVT